MKGSNNDARNILVEDINLATREILNE